MFWLTPLEAGNKKKSSLEEKVYSFMFNKVPADIAPTYAVHRDGADFNVKASDNQRCFPQNICNLGVIRD